MKQRVAMKGERQVVNRVQHAAKLRDAEPRGVARPLGACHQLGMRALGIGQLGVRHVELLRGDPGLAGRVGTVPERVGQA
ncbi:hypothetical protein D3C72_2112970 [compost metagenome]